MYLKDRLSQTNPQPQSSALRGNNAICAVQSALTSQLERDYNAGLLSRDEYKRHSAVFNADVRAFTSEVLS